MTTNPQNSVPFAKPAGYDPEYWELARRYFNHPDIVPRVNAPCGNVAGYGGGNAAGDRKFDLNNGGPISTDLVGGSWKYPNANYSQRDLIFEVRLTNLQSYLHIDLVSLQYAVLGTQIVHPILFVVYEFRSTT